MTQSESPNTHTQGPHEMFEGNASMTPEDMTPRGKWPPFPWNPATLENPLIGRDAALRELMHAFEDVVTDWAVRVQLLVSEYGMGKQRLMAAFVEGAVQRERNTFVVQLRCPETGGPYRLWDAILRKAFEIPGGADEVEAGAALMGAAETYLPNDAAEVAGLIAYLVDYELPSRPQLPIGADEEALVARCVGALGHLLEAIAFERPLLIVVAHANRASARDFALASALEATVKGRPLMMMFAGSPELTDHLPGWDRFPVIKLRPLDAGDSEQMLRLFLSGLEGTLPGPLVRQIVASAGGNSYGIKSMVRYLSEAGGIVQRGERFILDEEKLGTIELPENLEGVILARLGTLTPEERQILAQAAVVGRDFWLGALVAVARQTMDVPADMDEDIAPKRIREVLKKFVSQRFVESRVSRLPGEEAFNFRSKVHWRVALTMLPATISQRYHRVVGAWLSLQAEEHEDDFLFELARHAEGADHPGDAAVYYLRAAKNSLRENQSHAALRSLERAHALVKPDQTATRMRVLFELGDVHAYAGATDEAKRHYREALELSWRMRDRRKGARAFVKLAEVEQARGEHDQAKAHLLDGLRLYEVTQDSAGIARSCLALGKLHWLRGEFEHALRCYRKGEHIHRELRNDAGIASVLHAMGAVHYDRGDVSLAERFYTEALELRRLVGSARSVAQTLNNLGVAWMSRKLDRSVEVWKEAMELAEEIGDLGLQATLADNLGEALVALGRFDQADMYLQRAVELAELTGRKRTLVDALRNLGLLRLALEEWEGAELVLQKARKHADTLGLARLDALVARAMGDLAVAKIEATGVVGEDGGAGDLERAEVAYRHAAERFTQ
ncbi:MAG: tetratricopeptide (TPR) repeat protein, partial [Myxococcota bacterium]